MNFFLLNTSRWAYNQEGGRRAYNPFFCGIRKCMNVNAFCDLWVAEMFRKFSKLRFKNFQSICDQITV